MSDEVLGTVNLQRGQWLEVVDARSDWYRVKIKLSGKDSIGWVYKSYFYKRDELLARVTTQLASNGYGNLSTHFDASGKIVISGDLKHSVDIEKVKRLLVNILGVADVDTSNLRVTPAVPPAPGPGDAADYFFFSEKGAEWIYNESYKEGKWTLRYSNEGKGDFDGKDAVIFSWRRDGGAEVLLDFVKRLPEGVRLLGREFQTKDLSGRLQTTRRIKNEPPCCYWIKNPPASGTTWVSRDGTETATILEEEPVTVLAGRFVAIKIVYRTKEGTSTVWYSKGVGRVKTEGPLPGQVIELSSYRLSHAPIVQSLTKEDVDRSWQQTPRATQGEPPAPAKTPSEPPIQREPEPKESIAPPPKKF